MIQPDDDHATEPERPADDSIVDRPELAARLQVDARAVSRMVARGELPRPCLGAGGRPRWLWSFVLEHLRRRHASQEQVEKRLNSKLK